MAEIITILVGTMTGTAEMVADEIKDTLVAEGLTAEVLAMDKLTPVAFDRPGRFLICTSTYGQGDVPDNAMRLYDDLKERRPDLSGVRYGVLALGDHTYAQTFCHGGQRFDELLDTLNAERIGAMMKHDASAGTVPEEAGVAWAEAWVAALAARLSEAA